MDILIALAVVVGIIVVSVGLSFGVGGIVNLCFTVAENKRKKAHPQLWSWFAEIDNTMRKEVNYHNDNITPLKRQIDAILANWSYYSADTRSQKEKELEELRKELEIHEAVYCAMSAETQKIRDKIHNYVEENDLEWARQWGW